MSIKGLDYVLRLTDQMTGPLKGVMKSIEQLGDRGKSAMMKIGAGAAGLVATGVALKSALDPAINFSRALNEVKAAGVDDKGLEAVQKFAMDFSSTYGLAASDVVNSTNEIARAIDGLTTDELIAFSKGSNVLAKATGSNVKEMGSYLSTMYGIFQKQADKMGKAKWVEMMSGQATLTANMFKSSGESLSQAFTNLMATGETHGIAMAEQFAVLGNLQSVMPGGMSGTKYAAFLNGVTKAQKKLGLSFLDSKNKMLPMADILTKLKQKYGELDSNELAEIAKAFGTNDAAQVISYMLPKIDQLKDNIKEIGATQNLDDALRVSKITTDAWMRFSSILDNIKISIGSQILKKINPLLNKIADMGAEFVKWLNTYKNIARWIGYLVAAVIAFTGVAAALTIVSGIISAIGVAFSFLFSPITLVIVAIVGLGLLFYKFRAQVFEFIGSWVKGFKSVGVSFDPVLNAFGRLWASLKRAGNTILHIIGAFGGAGDSAISFASIGEFIGESFGHFLDVVLVAIEMIAVVFAGGADIFSSVWEGILADWENVKAAFNGGDLWDKFTAIGTMIGNIFKNAFQGVVNLFSSMINVLIEQANKLPGVNIPLIPKWEDSATNATANAAGGASGAMTALSSSVPSMPLAGVAVNQPNYQLGDSTQPNNGKVAKGAVTTNLQTTQNINRSVNISSMTIQANNPEQLGQQLRDSQQLAA